MIAKISFDCMFDDDKESCCFDGCYLVPSGEWKVFWFNSVSPYGRERIELDAVFISGVRGIVVEYGDRRPLSKAIVKTTLGGLLGVPIALSPNAS